MTTEEEVAFRKAVRKLLIELRQQGIDSWDFLVYVPDDTEPYEPFSVVLFQNGARGIIVPRHLGEEEGVDERFLSLMRLEAAALHARPLN